MENLEQVIKEVKLVKGKVDQIYYAIVGNEMSKDGGMLKRLNDVEDDVQQLLQFKQKFVWTMGLIAAGGSVVGFLLQFLISYLIKK